ncbi:HNH endonuclease [Pediococcus claussenii]|uniref:HNH endonuclease n=1 Tax=Pediococcus claussenii TaxID=187452 RepID=UPI00081AAF88|nr:HNH endonuclease [Pediococcus claussenii]ANZ70365.1 HNH endonuclease [Pediococcus claussenii]ANZ72181.1 HNH endonuclease [Pediococcus claussenii]
MPRVRRCRQYGCHSMCELPNHYCSKHFEHEAEYLEHRQQWQQRSKQQTHRYNIQTRNRSELKQTQYGFYRSKIWTSLRLRALERDNFVCQYCFQQKVITPAKTVDHTVPIEFDEKLKDKINNLAVICGRCHHRKTEWEQKYYGTGQKNKLKNVDEILEIKNIILLW